MLALLRDSSESINHNDRYVDERAAKSAADVLQTTVEEIRSRRPSRAA